MRNWLMITAANMAFGSEAVDAFKDAKHPNSPGGDKFTVEELLEMVAHGASHMASTAGIKPQVDVTQLPSRERIKEILANAGFTVTDKGTETAPTGLPLISTLAAKEEQPAPAESVTEVGNDAEDDNANAEEADDADATDDDDSSATTRRRRRK